MSCSRREAQILLHAHGQTRGLSRWWLEAHLSGCDSCRGRWARLVVEEEALRRAFAPLPLLDEEDERRLNAIAVAVRRERGSHSGRWLLLPGPQRLLALGGVALLGAAALSAAAAFWAPPHHLVAGFRENAAVAPVCGVRPHHLMPPGSVSGTRHRPPAPPAPGK